MKKRKFLLLTIILLSFVLSYQVFAKGPQGVMYTKHNLANWNTVADTFRSTNVNEVCVFCHTPHAAGGTPLWNREVETRVDRSGVPQPVYFVAYSSPYIHHTLPTQLGYETLLCMSCHDGVSSMNVLHNPPNSVSSVNMVGGGDQIGDGVNWDLLNSSARTTGFADIGDAYFVTDGNVSTYGGPGGAGDYYAGIGYMMFGVDIFTGKAVADHPISINYDEAYSAPGGNTRLRDKSLTGLPFYGSGKNMLECTTCHDPHVNYNPAKGGDIRYKPFLVRSNLSSGLCFSCHIK